MVLSRSPPAGHIALPAFLHSDLQAFRAFRSVHDHKPLPVRHHRRAPCLADLLETDHIRLFRLDHAGKLLQLCPLLCLDQAVDVHR